MNVLLKPELEEFVAEKIKASQFTDASGVVNEALEMLLEREQFTPEHEKRLRQEVRRGLAQLDRGERANFSAATIIAEEWRRL